MRWRESYFGVYFPICAATRWINTKIALECMHKLFSTRVHTLSYLLYDITNPQMKINTTIYTHRLRVSLSRLTFCWWCHNWLLVTSQYWITILGSRVRRFANDFTSDEVTSKNHWQIASRVTLKSLFTVTNVLFYFLHSIWCPEHTIPLKQLSIADFAIVAKGSLFWFSILASYSPIVLARANWRKGDLH